MNTSSTRDGDRPGRSPDDVVRLLAGDLSRHDRVRYLLVLLGALTVTGLVGALWLTEPALPVRTHLAFAGVVVLGLTWVGVAGWVLARRRPLYALDRVLATATALGTTTLVGGATVVLTAVRAGTRQALVTAVVAGVVVAAAGVLHLRARARRRALLARRRELSGTR